MTLSMSGLQQLGRALMLPIAVLPAAGLLLRLGQPDLLDIAFVAQAGAALFANLGLLFAIGVSVGFAREGHGAAGLAGTVCYLVVTFGSKVFIAVPPEVLSEVPEAYAAIFEADYKERALSRLSVPIGILSGLIAGVLYNRFSNIKLPEYLAFFGGKRFVPIAAACAGMLIALGVGLSIESLNVGVDWLSRQIIGAGSGGLFVYGVLNRILIVTGLHHILNNVAWFVVGDYGGVTGDLNRFFAGDPDAGGFMSGFFPVMMFGLPAACYAMYRAAPLERRAEVGGMLGSMALTSFLTGVTEPIEFTFMFLAPVLYAIHAVLTGLSMALMDLIGVKMGFGFSAGLFDYVINYTGSTQPLLLVPIGLLYALVYYFLFSFAIRRFNLATPGRDGVERSSDTTSTVSDSSEAIAYLEALGGSANLNSIEACTTRLRLIINDAAYVNEAALKRLGAKGVIRPSKNTMQVIIGPQAEQLADEMRKTNTRNDAIGPADSIAAPTVKTVSASDLSTSLQDALGGLANIVNCRAYAGRRLLIDLKDHSVISDLNLHALGVHRFADTGATSNELHLLMTENLSD